MKKTLLMAAVTVVSIFLLPQPAWAPLVCEDRIVTGCGRWMNTMSGARATALRRWRYEALIAYGSGWHYWTRARDKRRDCTRRRRDEYCCYSARPCIRAGVID